MTAPASFGRQAKKPKSQKAHKNIAGEVGGGWSFNDAETCIMREINQIRARNGRSALDWDRQVGYIARRHAKTMAASGGVFHDNNMGREITRWRSLGQNSGRAGGCDRVMDAFMNSSGHRANILGSWKHMGVGADRRGGSLYVQQVFESFEDPGNVYHYPG